MIMGFQHDRAHTAGLDRVYLCDFLDYTEQVLHGAPDFQHQFPSQQRVVVYLHRRDSLSRNWFFRCTLLWDDACAPRRQCIKIGEDHAEQYRLTPRPVADDE